MRVSIIVAVAENGVIGRGNALPWHLPADLARFRAITTGHTIIMGRRTWDSIGRPLPGRTSVVLSRDPRWSPAAEGVIVARSLDGALAAARARGETEAFVIGGQAVFELALPLADRVYLTRVHAAIEGDVVFPIAALDAFRVVGSERREADERHRSALTFEVRDRIEPPPLNAPRPRAR